MNGTAINKQNYNDSMCSRYGDNSYSNTAGPVSCATIMLGGSLIIPWETASAVLLESDAEQEFETSIIVSRTSFEYFLHTIENPPLPNVNLSRLLQSEYE